MGVYTSSGQVQIAPIRSTYKEDKYMLRDGSRNQKAKAMIVLQTEIVRVEGVWEDFVSGLFGLRCLNL